MKIKAYRIHQAGPRPLHEVAAWLAARPLVDRQFGGRSDIRLEEMRLGQRLLFLNFAHRRTGHGPGRMAADAPIQEIDLGEGEHFAEDTAVVIDMLTGYAAAQYNHHGPKASAIEEYLRLVDMAMVGADPAAGIDPDRFGFRWSIHLNEDGFERLRGLGLYREVSLEINVPGAREQDLLQGRALGQIIDNALPQGTETIRLVFKAAAPRNSALGDQGVEGFLTDARRLGDNLKKAVVRGRRAPGEPIEEIDLVEEQLSRIVELRIHRGERYAREDRWQALSETIQAWDAAGQLPVARA